MTKFDSNLIKVLYVEDEKDVRESISQILEVFGYDVTVAENGKLGVEMAESWKPDFILMDVRMPVMSGPEAIRRIRSNPEFVNVPIFAITAYNDSRTLSECEEAGANGSFTKPPDFTKLSTVIREIVTA